MKYIHILAQKTICTQEEEGNECDNVRAVAFVFDKCHNLDNQYNIVYPVTSNKDDILNLIDPNINEYSMVFDHVGSRPNDR